MRKWISRLVIVALALALAKTAMADSTQLPAYTANNANAESRTSPREAESPHSPMAKTFDVALAKDGAKNEGGDRDDPLECPASSVFSLDPYYIFMADARPSEESWGGGIFVIEHFENVPGLVCELQWWGVEIAEGATGPCEESDPTFMIEFYHEGDEGLPGELAYAQSITAVRQSTPYLFSTFGYIQYYTAELPTCVNMRSGWVLIQGQGDTDCGFYWLCSSAGDQSSLYDGGAGLMVDTWDRSLCLGNNTYVPVYGACCDQVTGVCTENVEWTNCLAETKRFLPNASCAEFDPPCGHYYGACCYNDFSCEMLTQQDCTAAAGTWLGADSTCDDCGPARVEWPIEEGGNGHLYAVVALANNITWEDANAAAQSFGGRLVTIESEAENQFVASLIADSAYWTYLSADDISVGPWLGGYQPADATEPDGGWQWIIGTPFDYINWAAGQPGNTTGTEDHLRYHAPGNTSGDTWGAAANDDAYARSYIIEYSPIDGEDCGTPIVIESLPFTDSRNTCDYQNDYVWVWQQTGEGGSNGPEVVYTITPETDLVLSFDITSNSGDYQSDLNLFIFEGACMDRLATAIMGYQLQYMQPEPLTQGHTYTIVIDGRYESCGQYDLTITGTIPEVSCGEGALFSHAPYTPAAFEDSQSANAEVSEASENMKFYTKFYDLDESICEVRWWGFEIESPGLGFASPECVKDQYPFEVAFYNNESDAPGTLVTAYTMTPDREPLGVYYTRQGFFGEVTYELISYHLVLPECQAMSDGWISIQGVAEDEDCLLHWMGTHFYGDKLAPSTTYREMNGTLSSFAFHEMSICLRHDSYVPTYGACCNEETGLCTDGVERLNCYGDNRQFTANTLCDDLDPPCGGAAGVCCHPTGLCEDVIASTCEAAGGTWLGPQATCLDCPAPTCPVGSLVSHAPHGRDSDDWVAGVADTLEGVAHYDRFTGVTAPITDVHWWGFNLAWVEGEWMPCDDPNDLFQISFHADYQNSLGEVVNTYAVTATRENTGVYYSAQQVELIHYHVQLDSYCSLDKGWIAIQGNGGDACCFLWLSSSEGDGAALRQDFGGLFEADSDLSFCLTSESYVPVFGACCDEDAGTCTNDVEQVDCLGASKRFVLGDDCDELEPMCGDLPGACCYAYPNDDCAVISEADCTANGGNWLGAYTLCRQCPCVICSALMTPEGEPDCEDGYVDTFNRGCGEAPFPTPYHSTIRCGDTVCGRSGLFHTEDSQYLDADSYLIEIEEDTLLTLSAAGGGENMYPQIQLYDITRGCNRKSDYLGIDTAIDDACYSALVTATVPQGVYEIRIVPAFWLGQPECGTQYALSVECSPATLPYGACCLPDDTCEILSQLECDRLWGHWAGESTSCEETPCAYPRGNTCDNPIDIVWPPVDQGFAYDLGSTFLCDNNYEEIPYAGHCMSFGANGRDMMYRLIPTQDSCVNIALEQHRLDDGSTLCSSQPRIAVFEECPSDVESVMARVCIDIGTADDGDASMGPLSLVEGQEYWIIVDAYAHTCKGFDFDLLVEPCNLDTPGSSCGNPIPVSLPAELPYVSRESTCGRSYFGDPGMAAIVYALNVTSEVTVDMRFESIQHDPHFRVYDHCPTSDPENFLAASDGWNPNFITGLTLTPGTYYVSSGELSMHFTFEMTASADTPIGACCQGEICVGNQTEAACGESGTWWPGEDCATFTCPDLNPQNLTCHASQLITTGQRIIGSTWTLDTIEGYSSSCADIPWNPDVKKYMSDGSGPIVWFEWTAEEDGVAVFSTAGSDYDTTLVLYEGCSVEDHELACSDDTWYAAQAELIYAVQAGETYYVRLSSINAQRGIYAFSVSMLGDELLGDIDADRDVDANDMNLFVSVLLGQETTAVYVSRSDINFDGAVDGLDIAPFISAIMGS